MGEVLFELLNTKYSFYDMTYRCDPSRPTEYHGWDALATEAAALSVSAQVDEESGQW